MNLQEIRQQFPMYESIPDADLAKALHQKFYSEVPFKDFSQKIGYLPGAQPEEYDTASPEYQAKYGATSGMGGFGKFRAGMGKGFVDLARGAGQLVGAVSRDDVAESRERDAPLMKTGAGIAGNITGTIAGLAPAAFIPGANTYAGAAAIGGATGALAPSTSTKETLTNTALGGVLSPAAMLATRGLVGAGRATKAALWDPLTKGGQERIAAGTLQSFAGGADDAAKAAQNIRGGMQSVLPGVEPTTAELARNEGIAQLERTLKNNPEFMTAFGNRAAGNRNAIIGALDDIAGDSGTRAAAEAARKTATEPLYQAATRANYKVDDELAGLLKRPVIQKAMERAKTLAENNGRTFSFEAPALNTFAGVGAPGKASQQITGQGLQDLKMALDEMLTDPSSGFTGAAGNTVKNLRGQIVGWMEKANPDFNAARTQYAELSKPIGQMDIGQALRDKLLPAMNDFGAQTRMRPQSFAQAMREGDATAANAMGKPYGKMTDIMAPEQMTTLNQIGEQLARRVNADDLGRAVGSNTGQNLVGQNALRQMLGPLGLPQNWVERAAGGPLMQGILGAPAKLAEKATGTIGEANVLKKLVEIGLSPEQALALIEKQTVAGPGLLRYQGAIAPAVSGANASRQ